MTASFLTSIVALTGGLCSLVLLRRLFRWRRWASDLASCVDTKVLDDLLVWSSEQSELVHAIQSLAERERLASASAERIAGVIEGMVAGVVAVDGDGSVVLVNSRAIEVLGLPTDQPLEGRLLAEAMRDPDVTDLLRLVRQGNAAGEGWGESLSRDVNVAGDEDIVLRVTASRLEEQPDTGRWFVLVFHDITAIRKLERMRRDFVANVSHELRTPLAAIGGYTETLLDGALDDPERARRFLEIIDRHSGRLGRLVNDLLTLSDLELGRTELDLVALRLGDVVTSCFEALESKAKAGGVDLAKEIPEELPVLFADADRLEQALLNIIDNAIKYTPEGGSVRVSGALVSGVNVPRESLIESELVEIRVRDTGVGVPAADLGRLTERFYRVDKVRSRELGGTGLGLAIVKHIVHAHGGLLEIESEEGQGTSVRMLIPTQGA